MKDLVNNWNSQPALLPSIAERQSLAAYSLFAIGDNIRVLVNF